MTARTTDVGALINAGASGGPALFVVSDISKLRVYVNVPQNYVPSIKIGTKAQARGAGISGPRLSPRPSRPRRSRSIRPPARRACSSSVDNPSGELMTGAFANVRLELPRPEVAINVPASALIFDQSGLRVATVGADNRVVLKTVTIARDLGKEVEIGSGLAADDRVIESPPDGIASGDQVRIVGEPGTATKSAREAAAQAARVSRLRRAGDTESYAGCFTADPGRDFEAIVLTRRSRRRADCPARTRIRSRRR